MDNKVKNLIALRSNLITIILTLTAGIIGLILSDIIFTKIVVFIIVGIYFDLIFIINAINVNSKLYDITKDK